MKYVGSCLCGKVKYQLIGEFNKFFFCHCEFCRKDTGSAHAANLFASNAEFKWLEGGEDVKVYNHKNEGHIKSFCPECGSALPSVQAERNLVVVPAGSLDCDLDVEPTGHIFMSHKANWDDHLESVAHFDILPNKVNKEK